MTRGRWPTDLRPGEQVRPRSGRYGGRRCTFLGTYSNGRNGGTYAEVRVHATVREAEVPYARVVDLDRA